MMDETAHLKFRDAALAAFSPARLGAWRAQAECLAHSMLNELPSDRPVDLVREFAEPWSLAVAMAVTGGDGDSEQLDGLARDVFEAAVEPRDSALRLRADLATAELAQHFQGGLASLYVQAFVALSQTLPCFLANAWLALLRHPGEMRLLRAEPNLVPNAMEELLRYAGPSRAQFRQAVTSVEIGGAKIARGEQVILMLAAANRDPMQFAEPDRLDLRRRGARHLAFGAGGHACIGAPVIRLTAGIATGAFLERFQTAELSHSIGWRDGFAIRAIESLHVLLPARTGR